MKNYFYLFVFLVFLVGCSAVSPTPVNEQQDEVKEENNLPELADVPTIEANRYDYRPEVGTKRVYMNGEDEIYTQEVIAADDEFIQVTISLSGAPTTHVYRWTNDEITLVYENSSPIHPHESILEEFEDQVLETFIDIQAINADWQVSDAEAVVTVPFGTYEDVLVIQKVTDEVEGEDTTYKRYFAKGLGMIKETFELTGENGYNDEANLTIVEPLN